MTNEYRPDMVSPPGETISECVELYDIAAEDMCDELELSPEDWQRLLSGDLTLDTRIAEILGTFFGGGTQFWLDREHNYRQHLQRKNEGGTP